MIAGHESFGVDFNVETEVAGETMPGNFEHASLVAALGLMECVTPHLGNRGGKTGGSGEGNPPAETQIQKTNRVLRANAAEAVQKSRDARKKEEG